MKPTLILKSLGALALLTVPVMLATHPRYVAADNAGAATGVQEPVSGDRPREIGDPGYGNAGSYLAAHYARDVGDVNAASYFFSHSLGHNPYDEQLMKQAVRTHVLAGRMDDAAQVSENLSVLYHGTQLSHLVLLTQGLHEGKLAEAEKNLQEINSYGLFSVIQPVLASWVALAQTGTPKEVAVSEHIRKLQIFDPLIAFQNALLFDAGNDVEKARSYYEQVAQDMDGLSYRTLLAMLNFYHRQKEDAKAREIFASYQSANAASPIIDGVDYEQALADAVREGGKPFVADAAEGVAEALFSMAGMLYGENVTAETQLYLQLALYLVPHMPDGLLMLGSIYEEQGEPAKAMEYFNQIPGKGAIYRRAQLRAAFLLAGEDKGDKALRVLSELHRTYPKSADVLVSEGDVYRKLSKFGRAADSYTEALALGGDGLQEYQWPVLFARGISYERDGKWEKAEKDFGRALELYPDQPDVLNYLGYSWLMKGTHLNKAKAMLEQAVAERPQDAHIIDSMGWALYMLGDYKGALEYLEQAVNLMPSDPVVNEHYGDALWQSGRRNEARFQWERALYFGPEEENRESIEKKLKSGMAVKETATHISAARN